MEDELEANIVLVRRYEKRLTAESVAVLVDIFYQRSARF